MRQKAVFFLMIITGILLIISVFSCQKEEVNELVINSMHSDQQLKEAFADLVKMFEEMYPDIQVTVNTTAHEQFKPLLPSWLSSKNAPDILTWFAAYRMQQYAIKGLLEPIDDVFPGGKFEVEFPKAFKDPCSYEGSIYFMPQDWYWWAVYYNKEVFEKAGIEQTPETWEEFLAVCETLKKSGISPIAIGARDTWTAGGWFDYMDSAVNGGTFHRDLTKGNVKYTDPKVKKTFRYLADLSKSGYFMENASSYSWQEAASKLFNGEAGMYLMGQFIHDVAPENVKAKLDFFKFPTVGELKKYSVDTPLNGYMVPARAKNKKNAKLFLSFLASAEAQDYFAKKLGRIAANKEVDVPNEQAEKGLTMVLGAESAMQFYDRDAPEEMAGKGMNAIVEILENPADMDRILEELDEERIRIYNNL